MWLFSITQSIFQDPLFSGRLVSVLCGVATLIGIYFVAKEYFSKSTALLAVYLYCVIPIFVFYDRQALMESAIGAICVWSVYFLMKFLQNPHQKYALFTGIVLAVGFWIKSSTAIVIIGVTAVLLAYLVRTKNKQSAVIFAVLTGLTFCLCILPLLLQPNFWATLPSNSRYSLTLSELLHFPILHWFGNLKNNIAIIFFFVTPLVFLTSIWGLTLALKNKVAPPFFIALCILTTLFAQTLLARGISQRYLVSFLPLLCLFAAFGTQQLSQKFNLKQYVVFPLLFVIPFGLTLLQLFDPISYIRDFSRFTTLSQQEYVSGYTSGIGIPETIAYLENKADTQPILVAIAENTGNPEDAMSAYFANNPQVKVFIFDARLYGEMLKTVDCLASSTPIYFITRDNYTAGVAKYFVPEKKITNPFSNYYVGIYSLNQHCSGRTLTLH